VRIELVDRRTSRPDPGDDWFAGNEQLIADLAAEVGPPEFQVELVLVPDGQMVQLNGQWRHADGPTDVLSFSHLAADADPQIAAGEFRFGAGLSLASPALPDEEGGLVGELVIAPDFVAHRCRENGWPVAAEFPLLIVHGLLHIVGWEHDTETRKTAMQDQEEEILRKHHLTHPLRPRS
jgi:probable rRNA maturation factor